MRAARQRIHGLGAGAALCIAVALALGAEAEAAQKNHMQVLANVSKAKAETQKELARNLRRNAPAGTKTTGQRSPDGGKAK